MIQSRQKEHQSFDGGEKTNILPVDPGPDEWEKLQKLLCQRDDPVLLVYALPPCSPAGGQARQEQTTLTRHMRRRRGSSCILRAVTEKPFHAAAKEWERKGEKNEHETFRKKGSIRYFERLHASEPAARHDHRRVGGGGDS